MANPIKIREIMGMNNVRDKEGSLAVPRVLLNADITAAKAAKVRAGQTLYVTLSGVHSIWGQTVMLAMAAGVLYRVRDGAATLLSNIGYDDPMYYTEVNNLVYMSSKTWNGVYDIASDTVRDWGIPNPTLGPEVSYTANGGLLVGVYHLCFTTLDDERLSGHGPIKQIELTAEGGISISNRPSDAIVWCTDPNGSDLLGYGEADSIVVSDGIQPLPTFMVEPPPYMENICLSHGRIWGSRDNTLFYSEPLAYEWFKPQSNRFDFEKDLLMVMPVLGGIYLGFSDSVIFLMGNNPNEMIERTVGKGVIPGTLAYGKNLGELGDNIPIWASKDGIIVGTHEGLLVDISQRKIRYDPGPRGSGLFRSYLGEPQYMAAFEQPKVVAFGDSVTAQIIRNGRVFEATYTEEIRDYLGLTETVTDEV